MMKRLNWIWIVLISLTLFLAGCSSSTAESGEGAVEMLCDCFLEAGVENEYDLMDLDHDEKQLKKVVKCMLPILKDVRSELDDMTDEERAEYFGDAIKAAVDCECGVKLLDIAAKLYDTEDGEEGFDEIIEMLEWMGGYYGDNYFFGTSSEEKYYEEAVEEAYYDDYYGEEYAEVVEEDCYGDYYALENDLIYKFIDNIANGNIQVGETTRSDMKYYIGSEEDFDRDYYGVNVSGYLEYDGDVLTSISLDYFYNCDGVLDYVDSDKSSITYAINQSLGMSGEYDGDYDNAGVEWLFNGMKVRQANFSDGYGIYIEED